MEVKYWKGPGNFELLQLAPKFPSVILPRHFRQSNSLCSISRTVHFKRSGPDNMPLDITIVGAGIGGLSAAVALRQGGHRVTVCKMHRATISQADINSRSSRNLSSRLRSERLVFQLASHLITIIQPKPNEPTIARLRKRGQLRTSFIVF